VFFSGKIFSLRWLTSFYNLGKLAESISEVNLNVFFQNALDYTEVFNQEPCMVNFFDFMTSMLAGDIPKLK
jgi:hypothetical protein